MAFLCNTSWFFPVISFNYINVIIIWTCTISLVSVIIFFSFLSIILLVFNKPLFFVPKNFICNNVIIAYVVEVFFYTFLPKGNTFLSLFFIQSFIFFPRDFAKFISKSTSGTNFFPKVSSRKKSLIYPYELLFQRCMVIYDVNESVG